MAVAVNRSKIDAYCEFCYVEATFSGWRCVVCFVACLPLPFRQNLLPLLVSAFLSPGPLRLRAYLSN